MKDFETSNAQNWENDSVVSSQTEGTIEVPDDGSPLASMNQVAQTIQVTLPPRQPTNDHVTAVRAARNPFVARTADSVHATASRNTSAYNSNPVHATASRVPSPSVSGTYHNAGTTSGHTRSSFKPSKDLWADPGGLITTKRANYIEYKARTIKEREQYLSSPGDEKFPSTGTFLWPYRKLSPIDLFGSKLTPLDAVRKEHEVFIEWKNFAGISIQYLCVSSRNPDANFAVVFDGIRRAIQDAKAREIHTNAQYLFVPPIAKAMRKIVRPLVYGTERPIHATSFTLSGDMLSSKEQKKWQDERPGIVAKNKRLFQTKLVTGLKALEPLKGWMRMRVAFGHVVVKSFRTPFTDGKYSYQDFVSMVGHARQDGYLDKKIGGSETAIKLCKKIVEWPDKFVPASGRALSLSDVKFKDTAIIFIKTSTDELRLETEIDRFYEQEQSEFQAGSVRLFVKEKTNTGFNITFVDVERQLDWHLEVITDSERFDIPTPLFDLIKESISVKSKIRRDGHGLEYPEVTPVLKYGKSDYHITSIVIRSVIQFKMIESGFIVELSIYREWLGSSTSGEPTFKTGVSMSHPTWETEMESIVDTVRVRDFGPGLVNLFDGATWLEPFLDEINFTQGLLVDVAKEINIEAADKAQTADEVAIAATKKAAAEVVAQWPVNKS